MANLEIFAERSVQLFNVSSPAVGFILCDVWLGLLKANEFFSLSPLHLLNLGSGSIIRLNLQSLWHHIVIGVSMLLID